MGETARTDEAVAVLLGALGAGVEPNDLVRLGVQIKGKSFIAQADAENPNPNPKPNPNPNPNPNPKRLRVGKALCCERLGPKIRVVVRVRPQ